MVSFNGSVLREQRTAPIAKPRDLLLQIIHRQPKVGHVNTHTISHHLRRTTTPASSFALAALCAASDTLRQARLLLWDLRQGHRDHALAEACKQDGLAADI